jgi:hypothetical protein
MKYELIKKEKYLLVLSEDDIKEGDWFNVEKWSHPHKVSNLSNNIISFTTNGGGMIGVDNVKKIIAHLPLNNVEYLDGVDVLPQIENDVEKLAESMLPKEGTPHRKWVKMGLIAGYNKAKELYKWTDDDVIQIVEKSKHTGLTAEYLMLSLQQPKYPIAFESETVKGICSCSCHRDSAIIHFVACCNDGFIDYGIRQTITNSQGITQWVGEYIY